MSLLKKLLAGIAILSMLVPAGAQENGTESTATKGRVMIVLDGSGSMLGEVGGQQKIVVARKALSDLLSDWDPAIEVGLIAYGHRTKGDCADIEVLVPCGPVDKAAITNAANNLTPLGKTPLSDATILAAETLKLSEEAATVILISDGEETCDKDPCAVARELESRGVNFTAHVIGFDVSDANHIAQLKCLAENTGGKFFSAADAGELQEALSSVAKEVSEEPAATETPQAFKLSAVLSEDGPAVNEAMRWTVFEIDPESGERGKRVQSYSDPVVTKLDIPAGKYEVEAVLGSAQATEPLDTEAGEVVVNLNAGIVNLTAQLDEGSNNLDKDLTWNVYKQDDPKQRVTYSYDAKARLVLPADDYNVEAHWGSSQVQKPVTVIAGETTSVQVLLDSGVLALNAVYAAEADPVKEGLSWTVTSAKADITGKHEKITHSYDAQPEFKLPAGDYRVIAKVGQAEVGGTFNVIPNDRVTSTVVMNAGVLHINSTTKPKNLVVHSAKTDITGKRERIEHTYDATATFTLPAGKYVVERVGEEDTTEKEAEVKPGERTEVTFE